MKVMEIKLKTKVGIGLSNYLRYEVWTPQEYHDQILESAYVTEEIRARSFICVQGVCAKA